ncbi:MAG: hypothetical protein CL885_04695 [Dehalococcoidia bacterium]|nr:hypothetical protein [Dehalococcoidia bacterium]
MDLEAEIGPVKYVAELIADITGAEFDISQAVRIVIVILIFVFDPLAILLVIAANISISKHFPEKKKPSSLTRAEEDFGKEEKKLELKTKELKNKRVELKSSSEKLEEEISLKEAAYAKNKKDLSKIEEDIKASKGKLAAIDSKIKNKEEKLSATEDSLNKTLAKMENAGDDLAEKEIQINKKKLELEKKSSENIAAEAELAAQARGIMEEKDKYNSQINDVKTTLETLKEDKNNKKEEVSALESKLENLESAISTQRSLISSLRDTYAEASKSGSLKDVFKSHGLSELVKMTDDGAKILSIKDSRDRVHQFIIPKEFNTLAHSYFHKIVESLDKVIDTDDLPHEYAIEVTKYIRGQRPQYNCLT